MIAGVVYFDGLTAHACHLTKSVAVAKAMISHTCIISLGLPKLTKPPRLPWVDGRRGPGSE